MASWFYILQRTRVYHSVHILAHHGSTYQAEWCILLGTYTGPPYGSMYHAGKIYLSHPDFFFSRIISFHTYRAK
ncbi:hypothetical protein MUK42_33931 [Musa troglodytarum]|uniref:Uncharacterized protein n=1 Tax=Musa troglodytarum TaxID=320322 RepID=A0A9E7JU10_9LILI|nr:hypothetical protein MUK42_33931 [Musa troglodytarum]